MTSYIDSEIWLVWSDNNLGFDKDEVMKNKKQTLKDVKIKQMAAANIVDNVVEQEKKERVMKKRMDELYKKFLVPIEIIPEGVIQFGGDYSYIAVAKRMIAMLIAKQNGEISEEEYNLLREEEDRRGDESFRLYNER